MTSTKRVDAFRQRNPWYRYREWAKRRCNDPKHPSYRYYGARSIRCLLTIEDVKALWIRDRAHLLKKPSLERLNANDHYTFENCCFIEYTVNSAKIKPIELATPENQKDLEWDE